MARLVSAARALPVRGFAVLPLVPGGKLPLIAKENGGKGVHDATTDAEVIERWWRTSPNANIGVACGEPSGIVVIDIDPRNGGDATLVELEEQHGALPVTLLGATGGDGWHYVYRHHPRVRNRKLGPGIDVLSTGKYFVAPPSIHPSGKRYRWARRMPMAELPDWFLDLIDPAPAPLPPSTPRVWRPHLDPVERGRRLCRAAQPAISGSGGHTATFSVAVALVRGLQIDAATALDILATEYNPRCEPPWARRELEHKVRQAVSRSDKPWGYLLSGRAA